LSLKESDGHAPKEWGGSFPYVHHLKDTVSAA
jgi:hypothetical protein